MARSQGHRSQETCFTDYSRPRHGKRQFNDSNAEDSGCQVKGEGIEIELIIVEDILKKKFAVRQEKVHPEKS